MKDYKFFKVSLISLLLISREFFGDNPSELSERMCACAWLREKRKWNKLLNESIKKLFLSVTEKKCLTYVKVPTKPSRTHTSAFSKFLDCFSFFVSSDRLFDCDEFTLWAFFSRKPFEAFQMVSTWWTAAESFLLLSSFVKDFYPTVWRPHKEFEWILAQASFKASKLII